MNYRYLRGFRYEDIDLRIGFDTDGAGLLTFNPLGPSPLGIDHRSGSSGSGFAIDLGVGAVVDRFEFGLGINGIANRIVWTDVERTESVLGSLFSGNFDLAEAPSQPVGDVRVELPVDYRGHVAFHPGPWTAVSEFGHGFSGPTFRGGLERRFRAIELRGGARYTVRRWSPAGGVGFNLTDRVGIDVAAFGTTTNLARKRSTAIAVSLRFNRKGASGL